MNLLDEYLLQNHKAGRQNPTKQNEICAVCKTSSAAEPRASIYFTCVNLLFGIPQIGHLSGGSPTTVLPHTMHT